MRKRANICLTAAAVFIFAFAEAVNAQDAAENGFPGAYPPAGTDTASVPADGVDIDNDNISRIDTVDTADTVNLSAVNTFDTVNNVNNDSSVIDKRTPSPKSDAEPAPLSGACWGFGAGLSVGTVPIFQMWRQHFPGSLRQLGLSDTGGGEAALLRYRVIETPDAFNFAIPLRLSLYNIGKKHVFALAVSFFRNSNEFQSTLDIADTVTRRINVLERLVYYSASIEAAGSWAIPQIFFSVDGAQQTFFSLVLGVSPINTFTREREIQTGFKNSDTRMQSAADSVGRKFAALSGNGLSLSWRAGLSVIKRYQSGYGAEFGLFYSGAYSGYFHSEGVRLTEDHIKTRGAGLNDESVNGGKPLSFLSNQAEFRATLLVPTRRGGNLTPDTLND
ncbi:MAG: hypothetical protein LBB74_07480 [Chitinispirillales bacterium]|jgi:hypothetical protein|nr:hypothetical protein [Chitinispirillales bacterium]